MSKIAYWKALMINRFHGLEESDRYNLHHFYLAMDSISKKLFNPDSYPIECAKSDMISEGEHMDFPLSNGGIIRLTFFEQGTEFALLENNGRDKKVLVAKEACRTENSKTEYVAISQLETAYNKNNDNMIKVGLGSKVPEELINTIIALKPGSIIQFSRNNTYVCESNNNGVITIVPIYSGNIKTFQLQDLKKYEEQSVTFNLANYIETMNKIQDFYIRNKKKNIDSIDAVVLPYSTLTRSFDGLLQGVKDSTKRIVLGSFEFLVHKDDKNGIKWYTKKHEELLPVNESSVRFLYGFLSTRPDILTCTRDKFDIRDKISDDIFKQNTDVLIAGRKYESAFKDMCAYVEENKKTLQLKYSGYVNIDNDLIATSFVFKYINGQCRVYKATHEDNDFTKSINHLQRCGKDEFISFCERDRNVMAQILIPGIKNRANMEKSQPDQLMKDLYNAISDSVSTRTNVHIGSTEIDSIIDQFEGREL